MNEKYYQIIIVVLFLALVTIGAFLLITSERDFARSEGYKQALDDVNNGKNPLANELLQRFDQIAYASITQKFVQQANTQGYITWSFPNDKNTMTEIKFYSQNEAEQ